MTQIKEQDREANALLSTQLNYWLLRYVPRFGSQDSIDINEMLGKLKRTKRLDEQNSLMTRIIYLIKKND